MDINGIEKIKQAAINKLDDTALHNQYVDAVLDYLEKNGVTDKILSVIISGIDIDYAANFYEFLDSKKESELQNIWKQIKRNDEIKKNGKNALAFITGLLTQSLTQNGAITNLKGGIIEFIVSMITMPGQPIVKKIYGNIIREFLLEDVDYPLLPEWEKLKIDSEKGRSFAEIIKNTVEDDDTGKYRNVKRWAEHGIEYEEGQIKKKKIEAKIPESKIHALEDIIKHYKNVEKIIHDNAYEIARLEDTIDILNKDISDLSRERQELQEKIVVLKKDVMSAQETIKKAQEEINERKAANDAFTTIKQNDIGSLLSDIAESLKPEYRDFSDSIKDKMDVNLGEIYREKIRNIFKILNSKGIRME